MRAASLLVGFCTSFCGVFVFWATKGLFPAVGTAACYSAAACLGLTSIVVAIADTGRLIRKTIEESNRGR